MSDPTTQSPSPAPSGRAVTDSGPRWTIAPGVAADEAAAGEPVIDGMAAGLRAVHDASGDVVASVAGGNPLTEGWSAPETWDGDLVIWSGSLAEDLGTVHPHTWMGPGRDRLAARVDELLPRVREQGSRLLLRAHARQVLSDPPSVRAFLAERASEPIGFVLEPAALFESSMLGEEAEDHLERILSGLGDLTDGLLLTDVRPAVEDACPSLVAPGEGELPAGALAAAIERWIDAACPRLLRAEHVRTG